MLTPINTTSSKRQKNKKGHLHLFFLHSLETNDGNFIYNSDEKFVEKYQQIQELSQKKGEQDVMKKDLNLSENDRKEAQKESKRFQQLREKSTTEINNERSVDQSLIFQQLVKMHFNCDVKFKQIKKNSDKGILTIEKLLFQNEQPIELNSLYDCEEFMKEMENLLNAIKMFIEKNEDIYIFKFGVTWEISNDLKCLEIYNQTQLKCSIPCEKLCKLLDHFKQHLIINENANDFEMQNIHQNQQYEEMISEIPNEQMRNQNEYSLNNTFFSSYNIDLMNYIDEVIFYDEMGNIISIDSTNNTNKMNQNVLSSFNFTFGTNSFEPNTFETFLNGSN